MQPACRDMDRTALRLAPPGDVVVLLGAAAPGVDHERAASRARRYYGDLDGRRVRVAPHPGTDLEGALAALAGAGVVVLPGGSPSRLLAVLRAGPDRLAAALVAAHRAGVALSGASAGAMVLCARTVLPDRGSGDGPVVADGLGLLPGLALVHDDGRERRGWQDPDAPDGVRWGLPEAGGLLLHEGTVRAVGKGTPRLVHAGRSTAVPREPVAVRDLLPGAPGGSP
jgi:cyanophycinase-like exopeptidase